MDDIINPNRPIRWTKNVLLDQNFANPILSKIAGGCYAVVCDSKYGTYVIGVDERGYPLVDVIHNDSEVSRTFFRKNNRIIENVPEELPAYVILYEYDNNLFVAGNKLFKKAEAEAEANRLSPDFNARTAKVL